MSQELYEEALATVRKLPDLEGFLSIVTKEFIDRKERFLPRVPNPNITYALLKAADDIYEHEIDIPAPPPASSSKIDQARYRDAIRAKIKTLSDPNFVNVASTALADMMSNFCLFLPPMAYSEEEQAPDMVSLASVMPQLAKGALGLITPFQRKVVEDVGVFADLRRQLERNMCRASGVPYPNTRYQLLTYPQDAKVFDPHDYFRDTPMLPVFDVSVPLNIPERTRMEHTVIVAGAGWGKTQLLQSLIARDLDKDDPPCLIVVDSTGAIIERVQRLAIFEKKLRDRILIVDPAQSPSLNMFDVSTARFEAYTEEQREDVQTEIVGLFNYIFASESYDLTAHMGLAFTYAVRLMLSRQCSTITDLRQLLEEPAPKTPGFAHSAFKADIERLDKDTQEFFAQHFFSAALVGARGAIARRLHSLVAVPAFRRMFTASANTLDLFAEMQKGTIILVNTNQQLLKDDAMVLFGRFVIAKALSAALERSVIPVEERRPAYLIIDEAAPYFDKTFESLLTRVRQFKLGVVIAFQHLEQATEKLRSAIASSTSIKYAGGVGFSDRRWLAHEMECAADFIGAQRKDGAQPPKWTKFAVYVRNYTQSALSLTIPFYTLEKMPVMSDEAHAAILEANKRRVAAIAAPTPKPAEPVSEAALKSAEPEAAPEPKPNPHGDHGEAGYY